MEKRRLSRRSYSTVLSVLVVACLLFLPPAEAATVSKYFEFRGAQELWHWTTTGKTKMGQDVTADTLPGEMTDPARLSWYDADGTLLAVYRNYRPGEFQALNDWKVATVTKLARFNLAGLASGTGEFPDWGETVAVTAIGEPSQEPLFDVVGTNWFAQTGWDADLNADAPRWWCDSQADAVGKDLAGSFADRVLYTFDDSAIWPDRTVPLWIRGIVTEDLAGMLGGTAPYGVLEGATRLPALDDLDGDGYVAPLPGTDCDDDPSDDPVQCPSQGGSCACGEAQCAPCAACIHPGGVEFSGDGIDSNCNGSEPEDWAPASANASTHGTFSHPGSRLFNALALLVLPAGAGVLMRSLHRKRPRT